MSLYFNNLNELFVFGVEDVDVVCIVLVVKNEWEMVQGVLRVWYLIR